MLVTAKFDELTYSVYSSSGIGVCRWCEFNRRWYNNNIKKADACKDIGLVVNTGKTKYMEIGRNWGMIANAHVKIGNNSYEKVKTFKYLGSLMTKQNSIHEEIKSTLKAGNLYKRKSQNLCVSPFITQERLYLC